MQPSSTLSPPSPTRPCRVGEWTLDPARCSLAHRDGSAQRLEPKVAEVLGYLGARAGEVVPRKELLDAPWPGVVVGDESLTQTVIKLRKAPGDATREPRYIETIAKRGYRLIAPVRAATAPARRWPAWGVAAALADAEWEAEEIRALQPAFRAAAWLATYPIVEPVQRQRLGAQLAALGL